MTSPTPRRVGYGSAASQYAELWSPPGPARGTVVVVHGGFWKAAYDLSLGRPLAASLVGHGWAAYNVEYRRVGAGGGVPATLHDLTAALDALRREAGAGTGGGPVVALGHSAGGHLAAWAGSHPLVTAVVAQAGVLDLRAAHAAGLGDGAVERFLGHPPGDADDWADPVRLVPPDVPVWCVHARADDVVPIAQSEAYVAAARAAGGRAELVEVPGDHFSVINPASPAWARQLRLLAALP